MAVIPVEARSEYIGCLEVSRIDDTEYVRFVGGNGERISKGLSEAIFLTVLTFL